MFRLMKLNQCLVEIFERSIHLHFFFVELITCGVFIDKNLIATESCWFISFMGRLMEPIEWFYC